MSKYYSLIEWIVTSVDETTEFTLYMHIFCRMFFCLTFWARPVPLQTDYRSWHKWKKQGQPLSIKFDAFRDIYAPHIFSTILPPGSIMRTINKAAASVFLITSCWAHIIAFDTATNREDAYMDISVRIFAQGTIQKYHILCLPLQTSHTGIMMFETVYNVLAALVGEILSVNLLSAATDGARNMTGRYQGTVTCLEWFAHSKFYRIWCIAYKLDLSIQSLITSVLHISFYHPMISFIWFLLQQTTLISEMGSICPTVSSKRSIHGSGNKVADFAS